MKEKQNNSTITDTLPQYEVFYSDSEEGARALAIDNFMKEMQNEALERPNISKKILLLGGILPVLLIVCIAVSAFCFEGIWKYVIITCAGLCIFILLKFVVIFIVQLYQKTAPAHIRNSCRFKPTCSQYMLLAIDKYGFWKGFIKGIKRLLKCHYPNGGIDYP